MLFNTLSQAQVVIDDTLRRVLSQLPSSGLNKEVKPVLDQLAEMGFVLDESSDEDKIIDKYFTQIIHDNTTLNFTVLTTYDCNFACPYCVEAGVKAPVVMDDSTARRAVSFIGTNL